jgi:hypothetical protein
MERIIFIHYLRILESSGKQVTNYYDFLFRRPYLTGCEISITSLYERYISKLL